MKLLASTLICLLLSVGVSSYTVWITVAYCPTYFTAGGAIVAVDAMTGNYSIVGRFEWPSSAIFGCPALYDPTVTFDESTGNLYLDFTEDFGELVVLNVPTAKIVSHEAPNDEFFVGYINMGYQAENSLLLGLSPTGTRNGEGEYQFGSLGTTDKAYTSLNDIPYKIITDDAHYLSNGVYWLQASYDIRTNNQDWCDPKDALAQCLIAINSTSGELISSTLANNYTVYKYASSLNANGTLLTFMFGYESLCNHPYEDFLFANLNLQDASTEPIACISKTTSIQEEEWISSFSDDNLYFAQASCDGSLAQFLVFSATTGATITNSDLSGLARELGSVSGLMFFWSVDFEPLSN